jgi:hypothetical protein
MGRPRCDPIDVNSVLLALAAGGTMLHLYRDYASTAARPYAQASLGGNGQAGAARKGAER